MKKILVAAAMFVFSFSMAHAQYGPRDDYGYRYEGHVRSDRTMDIEYMQREARRQINMGVERGSLSRRDAHMLMRRYEGIEMKQRRLSHRGRLSPREARILRSDLEQLMADTRNMSGRRGDEWAREPRRRY
ncbi:hypothetical protein [Dyadobacter sandarakinus]|uniref:Heavy-metal resistance n=1 Tax=Dyadobacter sandarakinus TaxID=2747268 RepID=A0ABX7I7P9_9BACT|nr:hypothetical protein [Dyadobacter sandarakinus]QRR01203.1 hypothetical protein HWI92_09945 [Dyadobacter sandarakinus]